MNRKVIFFISQKEIIITPNNINRIPRNVFYSKNFHFNNNTPIITLVIGSKVLKIDVLLWSYYFNAKLKESYSKSY